MDHPLSWECSDEGGAEVKRVVLCDGANFNLNCQFGVVYDVTGVCGCNNTLIMSNATFYVPPPGDIMTLNCSNGVYEEHVIVTTNGKWLYI